MKAWTSSVALASLVSLLSTVTSAQPNEKPPERAARGKEHVIGEDFPPVVRQQQEEINISVGENRTLPATNVRSYSEATPGIAEVRLTPDSSQFIIVGQQPGSTTLLLIKKDNTQVTYTINVFARSLERVESELVQLLEGTPGMRVRRVGPRFFIEGGVSTEPELKRIERIAAQFPGQVESLVVLGGAAAERRINVRIDFYFVQFDRGKSYQVGVGYPGRFGGGALHADFDFLTSAFTSATASVVNQPLPGLDLAATQGWAKILKHSTVIASNGCEAKFSSGGEQNFIVSSGLSTSLTQLPFGTNVAVLPRFDPASRELEVRVNAEVSDLTPSVASDVPGRSVSKVDTLVSLKLGQSIVLSGIRTRTERHSVSGLPLLSEIPVLGILFGSHGNAKEEVEGAVIVVPSVVESVPKGAREVLDEALTRYQGFSGDMTGIDAWDKVPPAPAPAPSAIVAPVSR
ncbi:MAG TPA: pilus assembly protein N-terminal domain-containing protein [Polyangiaceae bacterium]|nr:pilus assembly protein N-terminal domain-containing protein [Polyangiaceae bacterium]